MLTDMKTKNILKNSKTIAILGCSDKPHRTSYKVATYLKDNGFEIFPVNPNHDESLGIICCDTLHDINEDVSIDVVDIFRNPKYTAEMVEQIINWSKLTGQKPVIWTQLGVSSPTAKKKAKEAGFTYVENQCMMADHSRLLPA